MGRSWIQKSLLLLLLGQHRVRPCCYLLLTPESL